jgi:GNAT superfamily N-acetyltransferase
VCETAQSNLDHEFFIMDVASGYPLISGHLPVVVCRPARAADTEAAIDLVHTIWGGHDYVPHVWHEWLADPEGILAVAEYSGQVVGFGKLTHLSQDQWWLEGLRVHPGFQGRGIATHIYRYLLEIYRRLGQGTVRLVTSSKRKKIHHLSERFGFSRLGEMVEFAAPVVHGDADVFHKVSQEEVSAALTYTKHNPITVITGDLMDLGWRWAIPEASLVSKAIGEGFSWWWRKNEGLLFVFSYSDDEHQSLFISLVRTRRDLLIELLVDCRCLAANLGFSRVVWDCTFRTSIDFCTDCCRIRAVRRRSLISL